MTALRCAACNHVGDDVAPRIVEVTPDRMVTVYATDEPVPERFRLEARCADKYECQERRDAVEAL